MTTLETKCVYYMQMRIVPEIIWYRPTILYIPFFMCRKSVYIQPKSRNNVEHDLFCVAGSMDVISETQKMRS